MESSIPARIRKTVFALTLLFVITAPLAAFAAEEPEGWPREIDAGQAEIVVYQPQLESFEYDKLSARSAVMVRPKDGRDPVFGAMWFDARVSTDRDARMVHLDGITVTDVRFPNAKDTHIAEFKRVVEDAAEGSDMSVSLDRILAELDLVEKERTASENLKTDPPAIVFRTTPAVLVLVDGDPILQSIENSMYEYVVNTPFLIVRDPSSKTYHLKGGDYWYNAGKIEGPWKITSSPPKDLVELAEKAVQEAEAQPSGGEENPAQEAEPAPEIIVATKPTELLQCSGEPEYAPIDGTELLYMKNTENDILLDISSQTHYVLVSGRWYSSKSLADGPWTFVKPDEVPGDFANIPVDSDMASVRVSVPGTEEARDAVLDTQVPQTAQVSRKDATVEVKYDGEPKFEKIESTKVSYAINTDKSVLLIDGSYYCCDNAVWFVSKNPAGPWEVCVSVPDEVQEIPPSAPVYNVKYVYIYDYTPEVVYVGYKPGYMHSYVYHGCVVYGTGYYYHPWHRYYYYPRPVTYGFGVHYNPWTGWGFSFGMTYGWLHVGFHTYPGYRYGWWGPAGYHYGYRHGYHHGYHRGYWQGYYRGVQAGARPTPYGAPPRAPSQNIYRQRDGVRNTGDVRRRDVAAARPPQTMDRKAPGGAPVTSDRRAPSGDAGRPGKPATADRPQQQLGRPGQPATMDRSAQKLGTEPGTARSNNLYADKQGNVYRRSGKGWEQRGNNGWSTMDAQKSTRDRSQAQKTQQQLNRQYDARQRGDARAQSYQQGRPPQPRQTPSKTPSRTPAGKGGTKRR
jgi:hypothetical protein